MFWLDGLKKSSIHLFLQRGSKPMGETSGSLAAIGK